MAAGNGGRRPLALQAAGTARAAKPREKVFRAGHNRDMTDTGNRARKTSGTQGSTKFDKGGNSLPKHFERTANIRSKL